MSDITIRSYLNTACSITRSSSSWLILNGRGTTVAMVVIVLSVTLFSPTIIAADKAQAVDKPLSRGATLEISVTELEQKPVLYFLQSKNSATKKVLPVAAKHAQITSSMGQFHPPLQVLPVGTTLDVVNHDPILHNTHVFSGNRTVFNVATPNPDIKVQRIFSHPGLFGVRCDLHPSMNAWIAVVSNSDYAVISSPGVYRIENIEPGRYEVHIQRPEREDQIEEMELVAGEKRKIQLPP